MKLSIITINLNNEAGLRNSIESVVSQTYTDYEYIIIDGGSTDRSVEIIKEYSDKIAYWVSEPDKGIYNAMNKGISYAKGEFILFLNSGDLLFSNYSLEIVLNEIKNSTAQIFFGNFLFVATDKNNLKIINTKPVNSKADLLKIYFAHPSTFYMHDLFNRVGLFNENFKISADYDWYLNAIIKHKIKFCQINIPVSVFFEGGISTSKIEILNYESGQIVRNYFTEKEIKFFSGSIFNTINKISILNSIFLKIFNLKINNVKLL